MPHPHAPPPWIAGPAAFWFGREDSDHVAMILAEYAELLSLNRDRTPTSREPDLFIGCVERRIGDADDRGCLRTYDIIDLYRDVTPPLGTSLEKVERLHVLTTWSPDGLPAAVSRMRSRDLPAAPRARDYLTCLPLCTSLREVACRPLFVRFRSSERCGVYTTHLDPAFRCYAHTRWLHMAEKSGATAPPPCAPTAPLRLDPEPGKKTKGNKKKGKNMADKAEPNPLLCGFDDWMAGDCGTSCAEDDDDWGADP